MPSQDLNSRTVGWTQSGSVATSQQIRGSAVQNVPALHGGILHGKDALFWNHLVMYPADLMQHSYQVILKVSLPDYATDVYRSSKKSVLMGNDPTNVFTLPQLKCGQITSFFADLIEVDLDNYAPPPTFDPVTAPKLLANVPVEIERIVHFSAVDFSAAPPMRPSYILFGEGGEAHLAHKIEQNNDFQHVLTCESPSWISAMQINAGCSVTINDPAATGGLPMTTGTSYTASFQGRTESEFQGTIVAGDTALYIPGQT